MNAGKPHIFETSPLNLISNLRTQLETSPCSRRPQIKPQTHFTQDGLRQLSVSNLAVIGTYKMFRMIYEVAEPQHAI